MLGKRLIKAGAVAAGGLVPSEHFETVLYTGNGGTQRIGGYINRGAVFNGSSSYIVISTLPTLTAFSLSFWMKCPDPNADRGIFHPYNGSVNGVIGLFNSGTNFGFFPYDSAGSGFTSISSTDTNSLFDNNWHHVAIISADPDDVTQAAIYVDGVSKTLTTFNSWTKSAKMAGQLYFGKRSDGYADYDGLLDQVRIFNKAISSSEVTTLYGETYASSTISTTDIFNDNSGVALYQLDGNANDTGGVSGKFGSAAIFNGSSSHIDIPSPIPYTNTDLTFSCWFNLSSAFSSGFQTIIGAGNKSTGEGIIRILLRYSSANNYTIEPLRAYSGNSYYTPTSNYTAQTINAGIWYHLSYTYSATGNTAEIYLNGSLVSTTNLTTPSTDATNTEVLALGQYRDSSSAQNWNGKIDDVRIYSDVLTSTEVGYIYNNTTASIPTDNLEAYYKFDGDARDEQQQYDGTATNVSYAYNGTATNVTYQEATKFQPDLVWIKSRTNVPFPINHTLVDSVRGVNNIIRPNLTASEVSATTEITSFDSNGFSLGNGASVNYNGDNLVAWCLKGGGTAVSGTGTNASSITQSENSDAGFGIYKFTTTNSSGVDISISHNLNAAPELVFVKVLGRIGGWYTYHKDLSANQYLRLEDTGTPTTGTNSWGGGMTANSLGFRTDQVVYTNHNHVAYAFHSVDGFSKVGSYTGNGSTSGTIVETGFEPAWVMIKRTDVADNWSILDNERSTSNPRDEGLFPNLSEAELTNSGYSANFLSNGFQLASSNAGINASGGTYIYLAIAADPDTTTPTVQNSFDVVTWTGDGSSSRSISTDFKPDLIWVKARQSQNHTLFDSIRGVGRYLSSDTTNAEGTATTYGQLTSFDENGFTGSLGSNGTYSFFNSSSQTYVAWCWKAGDHDDNLPQINTEGTISSVVSVNAEAGFSIVKHTGTGSAATVGHGLSQAPELIIYKQTSSSAVGKNWVVYASPLGNTKGLALNLTAAFFTDADAWNNTSPTSTVFSLGAGDDNYATQTNVSGKENIAYCFHSVTGYQKVGSYSGSNSNLQVTTGFRPRFVLLKNTGAATPWAMFDSLRSGNLYANDSAAESDTASNYISFNSTGFELVGGTGSYINIAGYTWIYLAIK